MDTSQLIGVIVVWLAAAFNIAMSVLAIRRMKDRARREAEHRAVIDARVRAALDKLTTLPEWRASISVAGFLVWLASERSGAPAHIRAQAQALLPLEDMQVITPAKIGKVH